jgi:HK97 family phage prohead protease
MDLLKKACERAEFKMTDEGSGGFTGYASVFDVVDRGGDLVTKGAFSKSLDRFKQDGFIAVGHDWSQSGVATIKEAREDERGLWIEAEFHSTPDAQAERTKLAERLERGKSVGLSIGFRVPKGGTDRDPETKARRIKEIELYEVSIVTVPMNAEAQAVGVKSAGDVELKGLFEDVLAERKPSMYELWDVFTTCVSRVARLKRDSAGTGVEVDAPAMIEEALEEFTARIREIAVERAEGADSSYYYGLEDFERKGPPAGLALAAHADQVLATVDGYLARATTVHRLRTKDNRSLSVAHKEAAREIAERLDLGAKAARDFLSDVFGDAGESPAPEPEPVPESAASLKAASLRAISRALAAEG